MSVSPDTPTLCVDLIWRCAGELSAWQEVVAFDENPEFGEGRKAARRYRVAMIKGNAPATKPCSRIFTDLGEPIVASDDHPWLVYAKNRNSTNYRAGGADDSMPRDYPRTAGLAWRKTSDLVPGDEIAFFGKPWRQDHSRETGWLEGMFDGEGCLARSTPDDIRIPAWKVTVSQNRGPVLDRLRSELGNRGFSLYEADRLCTHLVLLGGWTEVLRFLGTVRPVRLLRRYAEEMLPEMPALSRGRTYETADVQSVDRLGERPVSSIETSGGTFITGGYLSHNTYQLVTNVKLTEAGLALIGGAS